MAGYSATPLIKKLGVKPGDRMAWLDAPEHFAALLGALPQGVTLKTSLRGHADVVICFVTHRSVLARRAPGLRRAIAPAGMAWVAWPKRSSGVATDVSEDTVRELALPTGLVDVKVCAIDDTWSGLKLMVRRELR